MCSLCLKVNWYEAMQLCAAKGLQGATFMTKEEYDRLVELMEDNGKCISI